MAQIPGSTTGSWPQSCPYFDARSMDADHVSSLLKHDSRYADTRDSWLEYLYMDAGAPRLCSWFNKDSQSEDLLSPKLSHSRVVVVHIKQVRQFTENLTVSRMSLSSHLWLTILSHFEVLPSFLPLLHSNTGGYLSHVSYAEDSHGKSPMSKATVSAANSKRPSAIHTAYKLGYWLHREAAVYARRDLITGQAFVLLLGTDTLLSLRPLYRLLLGNSNADVLHLVHSLHARSAMEIENVRWHFDHATQALESQTGITSVAFGPDHEPLKPEQLAYNKELSITSSKLRKLALGCDRVEKHFVRLSKHADEQREICALVPGRELDLSMIRNIRDSCDMHISLAQSRQDHIQELRNRIEDQIRVVEMLVSQRDTQLNMEIAAAARRDTEISVEIARATKRDSELMRGIAAVTMIFLPATFVATFFSMVFFHVGDERIIALKVDRNIWMYPTVTLPLTVGIVMWYFSWSFGWSYKWATAWLSSKKAEVSKQEQA